MSEEMNRISLSKKGQRTVTPFTGNELLYDYLNNLLDEERKKAVEAHLEASRDAQLDLQKIQTGLQYAEKLKQISVSQPLLEKMKAPSSYLAVLFQKSRFDQWPVGVKWGLEAIVVVFVIVTFLSLAPWEKVLNLRFSPSSDHVVITEMNRGTELSKDSAEAPPEAPVTNETPQFVDEGLKGKEAPATASAAAAKTTVPAVMAAAKATPAPAATTAAAVVATAAKPAAKPPVKVAKEEATAENSDEESDSDSKAAASTGYLYRGIVEVTNLEAVGPKIKDKIVELGGRKAGEVDLGWQKTPGSSYFHFTIPEAKYEELKSFLGEYGKVRISKEKHPRVMPDGIIRLIITVDEANK